MHEELGMAGVCGRRWSQEHQRETKVQHFPS